jgi:sulfite reductase (ferredoxin)
MSTDSKSNPVEVLKAQSNYLRGQIAQELADPGDEFSHDSNVLLKHHGTYQQDDRDLRAARRGEEGGKPGRAYSMMVRTKIPGGRLTSEQLLAELDLCDELGNATLRITSRQALQLHGVLKRNLKQAIRRINEVQLTTLAACGDVARNVMCCPAPYHVDPVHAEMQALADRLAEHLAPRTPAYHELWLTDLATGKRRLCGGTAEGEIEPLYGQTYLPRKFKAAIGLPGDNCVDLYTHDLGLLAICEDFRIVGYNVLVGGGLGVAPGAKKTFPALARPMAFIAPGEAVDLAAAMVRVFRDHGNRADRKMARLKYLIAEWGLEKFKTKVEEYYGRKLASPRADAVWGFDDHLGWHEQGDGRWFLGLNVENGRIHDRGELRLKSALREICRAFGPGVRFTAHQSLLFTDVAPEHREPIDQVLRDHGVRLAHEISNARRWSMACVALPTCPLAITESERALPGVMDALETQIARLGLEKEIFTIRMTGCPNGCSRPYNADIGLVGRAAGKYAIYLGGRLLGDRLGTLFQTVPAGEIAATLSPVLNQFKRERRPGESLGDFCHRQGVENLVKNRVEAIQPE